MHWQRCLRLLFSAAADTITFSAAVTACCEAANWQVAIQLFDLMNMASVGMNSVIFAELARACASGLQWEAMLSAVAEMGSAGYEPDSLVFASVVNALQESEQSIRFVEALMDLQTVATSLVGIPRGQRQFLMHFRSCFREGRSNRLKDESQHLCQSNVAHFLGTPPTPTDSPSFRPVIDTHSRPVNSIGAPPGDRARFRRPAAGGSTHHAGSTAPTVRCDPTRPVSNFRTFVASR